MRSTDIHIGGMVLRVKGTVFQVLSSRRASKFERRVSGGSKQAQTPSQLSETLLCCETGRTTIVLSHGY